MTIESVLRREPKFLWLFLGKVILLIATIVVVYALYAYLHAYRLDWLGWFYVKLSPLTISLYGLVEDLFPRRCEVQDTRSDYGRPRPAVALLASSHSHR